MDRFFESYSDSSDSDEEYRDECKDSIQSKVDGTSELNAPKLDPDPEVVTIQKTDETTSPKKTDQKLRFQQLQERKRKIVERSTRKRVKQLRKDILTKVKNSCSDDIDNDGNLIHTPSPEPGGSKSSPSTSSGALTWDDVRPHLNEFEHLKGIDKGKHNPKSGLEKKLDMAIELGQVDTAEKISDHLADRDFAKKISNAFDAKRFSTERKEKEQAKRKRKKAKLSWTFENKHRWETKSNM